MTTEAEADWLDDAFADVDFNEVGQEPIVRWPQAAEYNDAISAHAWAEDGLLAGSEPVIGELYDRPVMLCGANAAVFKLEAQDGSVSALRCFFGPPTDAAIRAAQIVDHIPKNLFDSIVPSVWIDQGLWVAGSWIPVQLSPWVEGSPLDQWIENNLHEPKRLELLADRITHQVVAMFDAGFSHGDLQHGNILVTAHDLPVLVDLDSVVIFDPATHALIDGWPAPAELGQPAYQHVQRMRLAEWAAGVDVFSCLVIDASLRLLAAEPEMWASHNNGDNLIIARADLEDPQTSELIQHMKGHADSRIATRAQQICAASEQPLNALSNAHRWLIDFEIVDEGDRWELDWFQGGSSTGTTQFGGAG